MTSHELANKLLSYPNTETVQFTDTGRKTTTVVGSVEPIFASVILRTDRPQTGEECIIDCIHLNARQITVT